MVYNIQALRALAAMLVVFHHLYGGWASAGQYGVDVFFVISGFVMVHVANAERGTFDFYLRRIIRIVPIYWLLTAVLWAGSVVKPGFMGSANGELGELLKSIFFIPYMNEKREALRPILYVGWTLNYEMFFYAIFGALLALKDRTRIVYATCAVLAVLVVAGFAIDGPPVFEFYTNPILLEFAAGMVLALYWERLKLSAPLATVVILLGLVGFLLVLPFDDDAWRGLVVGPFALVIVCAAMAAESAGHQITNRIVLLLGAASYSLYLSHVYVLALMKKVVGDATLVAGLLAVPLVAVMLYYAIELPSNRILRRAIDAGRLKSTKAPGSDSGN